MTFIACIKLLIARSRLLYNIYYVGGSLFFNVLRYLIPVDNKLILFSSYSGRKYDDSPRCIYEQMLKDDRFRGMRFIWAFENVEKYSYVQSEKVNINSFRYWLIVLKARCWITNVGIERGLSIKGRNVFYLNTWHGTPVKRIDNDMSFGKNVFQSNIKSWKVDVLCAQGAYEIEIYGRAFNISSDRIKLIGYPRNDILSQCNDLKRVQIKEMLGIDTDKKVILYAPTFREYDTNDIGEYMFLPPIDFVAWEKAMSSNYVILLKAHSAINKVFDFPFNSFLIDVSDYDCLNDLMLASDILISDYSSIYFDYSILSKPMLCFAYDYDRYNRYRGLYFDIRKELSDEIIENDNQLLNAILRLDYKRSIQRTIAFRNKYVTKYGSATSKSLDIVAENILEKGCS